MHALHVVSRVWCRIKMQTVVQAMIDQKRGEVKESEDMYSGQVQTM